MAVTKALKKEPQDIVVGTQELRESVKAKNSDAGIVDSLSKIISAKEKVIMDKDTQLYKLYDQLGTVREERATLKEANITLEGLNKQLGDKIKDLEAEIQDLLSEEEEEEDNGSMPKTVAGINTTMINQIKELIGMFNNTDGKQTVNAPNIQPDQNAITSHEFFGENNRGVLLMLQDWYLIDKDLLTVLNGILHLAKTNSDKYNLAKQILLNGE
jgi:hypothetical protein